MCCSNVIGLFVANLVVFLPFVRRVFIGFIVYKIIWKDEGVDIDAIETNPLVQSTIKVYIVHVVLIVFAVRRIVSI